MTFPNPNFNHQNLEMKIKKVIDSHGQHLDSLDEGTRELRKQEEGSIIVKPHEIPWMQHMIIERVRSLETKIQELKTSIDTYTSANLNNDKEKLEELRKEDNYLRHNFAEKFFKNPTDIEKE